MKKVEWARYAPALRRAGMQTPGASSKMWHDNESFLINPAVYRKHGLQSVRFPPCSGDLNPIKTVSARLRRDLSIREMEDLRVGKHVTAAQYRQRVAQLLNSYAVPAPGQTLSFVAEARPEHATPLGKIPGEQRWVLWILKPALHRSESLASR
jgi:hypothetical protein